MAIKIMSVIILGARKKAQFLINLVKKKYNITILLLRETYKDIQSDFKQVSEYKGRNM